MEYAAYHSSWFFGYHFDRGGAVVFARQQHKPHYIYGCIIYVCNIGMCDGTYDGYAGFPVHAVREGNSAASDTDWRPWGDCLCDDVLLPAAEADNAAGAGSSAGILWCRAPGRDCKDGKKGYSWDVGSRGMRGFPVCVSVCAGVWRGQGDLVFGFPCSLSVL